MKNSACSESQCIYHQVLKVSTIATMPRKQLLDAPGGDVITYDIVTPDGYRLCPFHASESDVQANFESVPRKPCRDDDILLVSYPKTGTNWIWEMLTLVLSKSPQISGSYKGTGMLEAFPADAQEALPSPRILNTHLKIKYLPQDVTKKKVKTVLICRNPKDVVVSFYNHTKGINMYKYDGKFENFLSMFMRGEVDYGSYPEYLLEWQQAIRDNPGWPIYVVYYENLKENCLEELKKLCDFLGQDLSHSLLEKIADICQIDKMRKTKNEVVNDRIKQRMSEILKNDYSFMRKGQVGDWKNWFTVAQNEAFDKWWMENTKDLDMFNFRYTLS